MSFPRRPTARVTFLSGKVTKAIGAGHDGLANIRLARLPCASRRARAGANSHVTVLKQSRLSRAPGCDAQRHATAPQSSLRHGHPWPAPGEHAGGLQSPTPLTNIAGLQPSVRQMKDL